MDRRTFVGSVAGGLVAAPLMTLAAKVWQIGYLIPTRRADGTALLVLVNQTLAELGYVDGRTMRLEVRTAEDDLDRLPALAAELVQVHVDIILAVSPPAILAASRATKTIPIVMAFWGGEGLIESGIVASFARPGGNVTGVFMLAGELDGKRLELLLQGLPNARRIAVLNSSEKIAPEVRQAAQAARIELTMTAVPGPNGYEPIFAALARERVDAVLVPSDPRFYLERQQIIEAAAKHRIPAMYEWGDMARAGGLMAYGPIMAELQRRVALYADHILKGAKPAELPVEQPSKFELVINMKTATQLGLTIPPSLVVRADDVIQ